MKANKKKIIVLAAMILLLATVGVLNFFLNTKPEDPINPDGNSTTIFASIRSERVLTRNAELEVLESIITFANSSQEAIDEAQLQKLTLTKNMDMELKLESLVKAKGFDDCLVIIGKDNINVTVMDSDLTPEENARILLVIATESQRSPGNIIITPYV